MGRGVPVLGCGAARPSVFATGIRGELLIYTIVSAVLSIASFIWYRLGHGVSRFFSVADVLIIIKASAMAVLCALIVCFLWTRLENVPRAVPVLHFIVLAGGTIAARAERYFRRRRRNRVDLAAAAPENILILGVTDLSWFYIQMIEDLAPDAYNVVGLLDESRTLQGRFVQGYPVAGRVRDVGQVVEEYAIHGVKIHRLVLATEVQALDGELSEALVRVAESKSIPLDVLPDRLGLKRPDRADGRASGSEPLIPHVGGLFWASKRIFDVAASAILLTLTAPIAVVVLILVLLDCGLPVMFWQMRVGRLGRRITVYKFRTLRAPYMRNGDVRPEQERVSAIGRLLRRTHVDELPQLFSILRGEMSFIGPRPLLPVDLSRQAKLRFAVRPGISGWAQVNGATSLTIEEKNAMDEWYIRHASWGVEFAIVVKTLKAIFAVMRRNEPAIQAALTEQNASMSLAARCQSSGEMAADRHP